MKVIFQKVPSRLVVISLLLIDGAMPAWSSEPIHLYYRPLNKNSANALTDAQAKLEKGDLEGARRTADAVIKADPTFHAIYYVRAQVFIRQHKYQEAARDCNMALLLDPTFGEAALVRAVANYHLGRYAESLKEIDHVASIPLRHDAVARAYRDRAWIRLNCPDRSYRNPQQALKDAKAACTLIGWRDEDMIDLLATACAETGDFDSAVRYEEKALSIAGMEGENARRLQRHLDSFKQHKTL